LNPALAELRFWELLEHAREREASDLHLATEEPPAIRVDGELIRLDAPAIDSDEMAKFADVAFVARVRTLLHEGGDAGCVVRREGIGAFRVHAFRALGRLRLAIRLLARGVPSLERLHLPSIIPMFAQRKAGLVLFVGPTGSGKTTALAALVDRINRTRSRHIVTIEDPVEYCHTSVRSIVAHREIGADAVDYASALFAALRADPDVIVVGELREAATMRAALTAAETGHLVLSTLHTGDAAQTVDRIVDAFDSAGQAEVRVQLAQTLVAVASIRLVPRASGRGRRAAVEVLVATDAVRALIRDGKTHQLRNAIVTGRDSGMQTLETHLSELVVRRDVSLDAARAATDRPQEIRSLAGAS
jgi:twitching motility protein PilT